MVVLFMILIALTVAPHEAPDEAGGNILQINRHALGLPVAQFMHQQQHCPTSGQQGIQNHPVQLP
jgi:hypothetical protein